MGYVLPLRDDPRSVSLSSEALHINQKPFRRTYNFSTTFNPAGGDYAKVRHRASYSRHRQAVARGTSGNVAAILWCGAVDRAAAPMGGKLRNLGQDLLCVHRRK